MTTDIQFHNSAFVRIARMVFSRTFSKFYYGNDASDLFVGLRFSEICTDASFPKLRALNDGREKEPTAEEDEFTSVPKHA